MTLVDDFSGLDPVNRSRALCVCCLASNFWTLSFGSDIYHTSPIVLLDAVYSGIESQGHRLELAFIGGNSGSATAGMADRVLVSANNKSTLKS